MEDTLFINEEYYNKNISHKRIADHNQILSSIRLVQQTNLLSIITQPVYDRIKLVIEDAGEDFTVEEEKLFLSVQLFLAVKTAEEVVYAAPSGEDSKERGAHLVYRSKSSLLEARMVRIINNDADLLTLAQSGSVDFDDNEMDVQGGFYFD